MRKKVRGFVTSFVNAFLPEYKNESDDIYKYGKDNLLSNQLLSYVADSGVATRAANKLAEYISADGFTEPTSANFKVNEKQTADELLNEVSAYAALLTGVAFHISRKGGKVSSVKSIPVQCVRKRISGGYLYNETLGQPKYDKTKGKTYPAFVPGDLPNELIASPVYKNGEILYMYLKTPLNAHYPVPDYYAGIEDIRTSSELTKFDLETVYNGFVTSAMITMVGDIDDQTKDAAGFTELDYIKEDFRQFTGQEKNDIGLSGRNKAWLNFAKTKDEVPVVQQFDTKSILDASNSKRDVIERSVCRLFGVHPVLVGYSDAAVLGNTQAISNASLELAKVANRYQKMITQAFKMMFPTMEWNLSEYMPINYIDPALFDRMTEDEIRNKLLGLPPKETEATPEGNKTISALNSLSPLVANKVLESMTPDEIRELVGLGAKIVDPLNQNNGSVNS